MASIEKWCSPDAMSTPTTPNSRVASAVCTTSMDHSGLKLIQHKSWRTTTEKSSWPRFKPREIASTYVRAMPSGGASLNCSSKNSCGEYLKS